MEIKGEMRSGQMEICSVVFLNNIIARRSKSVYQNRVYNLLHDIIFNWIFKNS